MLLFLEKCFKLYIHNIILTIFSTVAKTLLTFNGSKDKFLVCFLKDSLVVYFSSISAQKKTYGKVRRDSMNLNKIVFGLTLQSSNLYRVTTFQFIYINKKYIIFK